MKYCKNLTVTCNIPLANNFFYLTLRSAENLPQINPGQFVQILSAAGNGQKLRRPISVCDVDYAKNEIMLLIQIVGDCTRAMSEVKTGDEISVIYPLGNGFEVTDDKVLMIGGGVGVAPMLYLAKEYAKRGIRQDLLIGVRTKEHLLLAEEFNKYANLHITTEDGSLGVKGLVIVHPVLRNRYDRIYCCGPDPMMRAVAKAAKDSQTPCYLSLEERMACGIGACLCCVVNTQDGNRCTCTEGPVFLADNLIF
ncbi:MAG: dihydroorotate dehydrogenase electron transfer subunit [Bacteroidales bacterium]|jgi:dihydroorotate dehydrogenase electron transfer subunit|nr:dihydroorotate dehydrogenase electron transfer subunit [Bacteroidales bacterium]